MEVLQLFTASSLRNFSYLIFDKESRESICLDPYDADQILAVLEAQNLTLSFIVNTHEHWDHTQGNIKLKAATKCKVLGHTNAGTSIPGFDQGITNGEIISLGKNEDYQLKVLDTPGHTFCHICLLLMKGDVPVGIFSGDTFFNAGVGNCHNGGSPEVLYETITKQFANLPEDVRVYPGHEYLENNLKFTLSCEPGNINALSWLARYEKPSVDQNFLTTTMKDEREINLFLRLDEQQVKRHVGELAGSRKNVFLKLRSLRDKW